MISTINSFNDQYEFLSNTFQSPIEIDGISYTNAMAAYYAQGIKDVNARKKFSRLSGFKAKIKASKAAGFVEDWEDNPMKYMELVLRAKFKDPKLKSLLFNTKGKKLLNNNTYGDEYWGIYLGKGGNRLGKLLMKIRDEE